MTYMSLGARGLMENILLQKMARLDTANSVMPYAKFSSAVFQVYGTCGSLFYPFIALNKVGSVCGSTWLNIRTARRSCPDV